jgi:GMP synthase (glutamine-hydrolysing)
MDRPFLILDFGSQLTQLIARRLRELGYYSEIQAFDFATEKIKALNPWGIILSGGPNSVYEKESPRRSTQELIEIAPVLGICYGMQLLSFDLGGKVEKSEHREYGFHHVRWDLPTTEKSREAAGTFSRRLTNISPARRLRLDEVPETQRVWMSHGDSVKEVPSGFAVIARSESQHPAAMIGQVGKNPVMGLQFHPEVAHTEHGMEILKAYAEDLCGAVATWNAPHITEVLKAKVREQVGPSDHVLVGLSGGVDSSVVATLLTQTLGAERVHCLFVNNGLLRQNEYEEVMEQYKHIGLNVHGVDASQKFLSELKGQMDPEAKRKVIGRVFIEVFDEAIAKLAQKDNANGAAIDQIKWLAQGTLYPDVIESTSSKGGPSHTIKSHHNVGGLPEKMKLKLVEPVRELFKDEVRKIGAELGLPHEMLWRHPFPGPGLSIRIIGEVTAEALKIVREADAIFIKHLRDKKLYHKIWQAFCVLTSVQTVGVQGDGRTYDQVLALRAVTSSDGMTADWYGFDFDFLRDVSREITNKVRGVSRVVYDVTSKPPATIEWE